MSKNISSRLRRTAASLAALGLVTGLATGCSDSSRATVGTAEATPTSSPGTTKAGSSSTTAPPVDTTPPEPGKGTASAATTARVYPASRGIAYIQDADGYTYSLTYAIGDASDPKVDTAQDKPGYETVSQHFQPSRLQLVNTTKGRNIDLARFGVVQLEILEGFAVSSPACRAPTIRGTGAIKGFGEICLLPIASFNSQTGDLEPGQGINLEPYSMNVVNPEATIMFPGTSEHDADALIQALKEGPVLTVLAALASPGRYPNYCAIGPERGDSRILLGSPGHADLRC